MPLPDLLGKVGASMSGQTTGPMTLPGLIGGFGGGTFNPDGTQVTDDLGPMPFEMQMMEPGAAMAGRSMPQQQPKRDSGLRRFLGNLGDALLAGSGAEPVYGPSVRRREMGDKLAAYLGTGDQQLADIMRTDPETGMALLKFKSRMTPKPQDPTALMQNMEYLRRLNPTLTDQQLAEVAQYAIAAPRMYGSPETGFSPDPNYPFTRGGEAQPQGGVQEGQTATNPQTGEKIVYRNGAWVPMGGASGNAGGGFP